MRGTLPRVAALGAAILLAALYALLASSDPREALAAFFVGPFANPYSLNSLLESAAPLLACALGACIAFRAGSFNLGGEGQASVGTLAAALAGAALGGHRGLPSFFGTTLAISPPRLPDPPWPSSLRLPSAAQAPKSCSPAFSSRSRHRSAWIGLSAVPCATRARTCSRCRPWKRVYAFHSSRLRLH